MKTSILSFVMAILLISISGWAAPSTEAASRNRAYPGGADEESLRVLEALPAATRKVDARELQRQVYRNIYKREAEHLKGSSEETIEE